MGEMVSGELAQGVRCHDRVVLKQKHILAWLDQLPDLIVNRRYSAPARVDAELPALPGDVALDAETLRELRLLNQVASRQEEVGLAVDKCQQAGPLTVALQHFQGGKDFQQMLLTADWKNDCCCWQRK
jgi:hypothetical protein